MSITVIEKTPASVPTPASGKITLFADSTDGVFKQKDDTGTVSEFGSTTASAVANTPSGNISATNVQAAINELDTEKAPVVHTHIASNVTDFNAAADARVAAGIATHVADSNPHPVYLTEPEADLLYDAIGAAAAAQAFAIQRSNHTGTQDLSTVTGTASAIPSFDGTGVMQESPGWVFNQTTSGYNVSVDQQPDNLGGGQQWNQYFINLKPLQNSPNEGWNANNYSAFIDPDSSGYDLGTGVTAITLINEYIQHLGTSDVGQIVYHNYNSELGNGVDAITIGGLNFHQLYANLRDNSTLDGPLQGIIFNPSANSLALTGSSNYTNAFADFANLPIDVGSYQSFSATPVIGAIKNNSGYTGVNIAPTITDFLGNAGFTGVNITPNITDFDTGFFSGINVNPTVGDIVNAVGLRVDVSNINESGSKNAAEFVGNVSITGNLNFSGALSIGQLNAFYAQNPVDGGGNPTTLHGLTTGVTALNGVTTANCDTIGVSTAMLVTLQANSINTSGPFGLGFAAQALACVVETHTGSTLDFMSGTVAAINMSGTSTGGTIDTVNINRSTLIPNGITTINQCRGFFYHEPFGPTATKSHGLYVEDAASYMESGLLIGGTPLSDDTLTNSSVAFEIKSTTRAAVEARMTTTQRDALTAINGMTIYNTTTDKFQGYAGGAWVDLH